MIIRADSRYIPLPDKSVNCIITSPPYWSLRKYDIPDLIWDGGNNDDTRRSNHDNLHSGDNRDDILSHNPERVKCEHEWEIKEHYTCGQSDKHTSGPIKGLEKEWSEGFCKLCGAWRGQLGLEPAIDLYLKHLLQIMDECKRVLRDSGTMWVNLGDSYNSHGVGREWAEDAKNKKLAKGVWRSGGRDSQYMAASYKTNSGLPDKTLCCIPERFAIEMINHGWWLRNKIIWHKPNCMPSSAKDRFTVDFEPVFFFVKSNDTQYWTNEKTGQLVSKQPLGTKGIEGEDWEWREVGRSEEEEEELQQIIEERGITRQAAGREVKIEDCKGEMKKVSFWSGHDYYFEQQYESFSRQGRNRRCVWTITTQPYPESHFATFPEALVEPMIRAGCPKEICKKCGNPREKIIEIERPDDYDPSIIDKEYQEHCKKASGSKGTNRPLSKIFKDSLGSKRIEKGLTDCGCNAGFEGAVVLDPFCGSGTVGKVCNYLFDMHIKFVGLDLGYQNLGKKRTRKVGIYY